MPTVQINKNEQYTFARWNPYGSSVFTIVTDSTDSAQKAKTFNNQVLINTKNSGVVAPLLNISTTGNTTGTNGGMIRLNNTTTSGGSGLSFYGQNQWTIGTFNDTSNEDDFQITDSATLVTSAARTSTSVGIAISKSKQLYYPNIANVPGSNYVRWDATSRQITYLTSTRKVKKNIISPHSTVYDSILALQPRYFEMKNPKDAGKQYLSFIAEETAAVSPCFATYGPDWAYDDTGLQKEKEMLSDKQVPMDIDERAIIAALVGKVQQLEQRLQQLESQ